MLGPDRTSSPASRGTRHELRSGCAAPARWRTHFPCPSLLGQKEAVGAPFLWQKGAPSALFSAPRGATAAATAPAGLPRSPFAPLQPPRSARGGAFAQRDGYSRLRHLSAITWMALPNAVLQFLTKGVVSPLPRHRHCYRHGLCLRYEVFSSKTFQNRRAFQKISRH